MRSANFSHLEQVASAASLSANARGRFTIARYDAEPLPLVTYTDTLVIAAPDDDHVIALGGVIVRSTYGMALERATSPIPEVRLSSIQTDASHSAGKQADVVDVAIAADDDDAPITDVDAPPVESVVANYATTDAADWYSPQREAETSVTRYGVGESSDGGGVSPFAKRKASVSAKSAKRNPKAVQQVIDYLIAHPNDIGLTVAQLTDKLKYDVRIKVGHSSVGKALAIMRTDGREKAS